MHALSQGLITNGPSRSYCIIACGGAPLSVIKQFVEQQKAPD
jgi:hypothetical protein